MTLSMLELQVVPTVPIVLSQFVIIIALCNTCQSLMKKSMLRLTVTATGEEFFELNKAEPGAVLSIKNHTGGIDGSEDHEDGKIFSCPRFQKMPG